MAQGRNTGLQYRPLQGDLASDILNQEKMDLAVRQEQRLIADRKAKAEADKAKKAQEGLARAKALKLYDTGSSTLNGTLAEAVSIATSEYPRIFEVLDDTTGKYSKADKLKAQVKYDNILNLPENLKLMTNAVMGEYAEYEKGVKDGTVWRDEEYEKRFENGYKGVNISIDDDGMPVGLFKKGQSDTNNDGVIDDLDVETLNSLNDVNSRPQFQKKVSYDALVTKHAEKMESAINTDSNGFRSKTTTGVEVDLLNQSVKRVLYDEFGKPTDIMKSFLRDRGFNHTEPSKEDLEKVESDYKNDILIRTKRGVVEDVDAGAIVANKRENRLAKEDEVNKTTVTFDEQLAKDDFTNKTLKTGVIKSKMIAIPEKSVEFKNLGGDGSGLNNGYVTGFALQNDGTIIVTGKALKTKNAKFKIGGADMGYAAAVELAEDGNSEAAAALNSYTSADNYGKFVREPSGTELGAMAITAGYKSVDELRAELQEINKSEPSTGVGSKYNN